jgi:hypothetical protein
MQAARTTRMLLKDSSSSSSSSRVQNQPHASYSYKGSQTSSNKHPSSRSWLAAASRQGSSHMQPAYQVLPIEIPCTPCGLMGSYGPQPAGGRGALLHYDLFRNGNL